MVAPDDQPSDVRSQPAEAAVVPVPHHHRSRFRLVRRFQRWRRFSPTNEIVATLVVLGLVLVGAVLAVFYLVIG